MYNISKALKEYFYAWGDNDPDKKVLRYGKYVSLKQLHEYDDYVYYRPRRQMVGRVIICGGLAGGYYLGSSLKEKYDKRKEDKGNL